MARLGFDYSMAGDARYTAFSAFFYIAVLGLGFSVYAEAKPQAFHQAHRAFCRRHFFRDHSHALGDHLQKGARPSGNLQTRVGTFAARDALERSDSGKSRDRPVNTRASLEDDCHDSHPGRERCAAATPRQPETRQRHQRAPKYRRRLGRRPWTKPGSRPPATSRFKAGRACPSRIAPPIAWWSASRPPRAVAAVLCFRNGREPARRGPAFWTWWANPRGILRPGRFGQPPTWRYHHQSLGDRPSERTRVSAGRPGQAPGSALIARSLNAFPRAPAAAPPAPGRFRRAGAGSASPGPSR